MGSLILFSCIMFMTYNAPRDLIFTVKIKCTLMAPVYVSIINSDQNYD